MIIPGANTVFNAVPSSKFSLQSERQNHRLRPVFEQKIA